MAEERHSEAEERAERGDVKPSDASEAHGHPPASQPIATPRRREPAAESASGAHPQAASGAIPSLSRTDLAPVSSAIPSLSRTDLAPVSGAIPTLSRADLAPVSGAIPTLSRADLAPVSGAIPTLSRADLAPVAGAMLTFEPGGAAAASGELPSLGRAGRTPVPGPDPRVSNLSAASQASIQAVGGPDPFAGDPELSLPPQAEPLPDDFTLGSAAPVAPLARRHQLPPDPARSGGDAFTLHSQDNLEPVSDEPSAPPSHITNYGTPKIGNRQAEIAARRKATIAILLRIAIAVAVVEVVAFTFGPDLPGTLGEIFASIQAASSG